MNNIKPIYTPPFNPLIPQTYGDEMSYYETLRVCIDKINECIEEIGKITDEAVRQAKAYTDSKLSEFQAVVDGFVEQFNQQIISLNQQYNQFTYTVSNNLASMQSQINAFDNRLTNSITAVNARTDLAIAQNNVYILEEIGKGLVTLKVTNFFTGELMTVQQMFDYLAQFHAENSLTYTELIAKNKTINALIALNATYQQLIINGKIIIV